MPGWESDNTPEITNCCCIPLGNTLDEGMGDMLLMCMLVQERYTRVCGLKSTCLCCENLWHAVAQ